MSIENKVEEYLEHYNHNHDPNTGRFTFSGAVGAIVSSVRASRSRRLEERTKRDKDKLAYQKIKSKARQARAKLKAEKKISKSREKLIRAKGEAKSKELIKKAQIAKGTSKAEKAFDKDLDIKGKTAAERNANREQLRRDKSAEIKEAIESGSVAKLAKYKDLMTTNEINTAVNRINADNSVKNLQVKKIDSMIGKAEKAINTVDRVMQAKNKVDRWIQDSENAEKRATEAEKKAERQKTVLELYKKATGGDKSAIEKLEDIAAQRDIDNDNVNKVIERATKLNKKREKDKGK